MLSDDLKILLATEYAFVIKAQLFHWNVEGQTLHNCMNSLAISMKKSTATALIVQQNLFVPWMTTRLAVLNVFKNCL